MAGIEIATGELLPATPASLVPLECLVISNKRDASTWLRHISALLGNWEVEASPYVSRANNKMLFEAEMFMMTVADNIDRGYENV